MVKRKEFGWPAETTGGLDAPDFDHGASRRKSLDDIAHSLKQSAEANRRRKPNSFRVAMSMLTLHLHRPVKNPLRSASHEREETKDVPRDDFEKN